MTLPEAEAAARRVVARAVAEGRAVDLSRLYYATVATALIAQPLPLVLPNGLPAPEPEVEQ